MVFPSVHQPPKRVQPGEEALHAPSPAVAPQRTAILRRPFPSANVGRDQLDSVLLPEALVEPVRVVRLVADEVLGEFVKKALPQDFFDQLGFVRRSALHRYGERKTVTSGDSDDLRALPTLGRPDGKAPFFALLNEASMKASLKSSLPSACRCCASRRSARSSLPVRTHCWKRRWQVWNRGYLEGSSRHCAPVPNTHNTPFSTARVSCHGRPR